MPKFKVTVEAVITYTHEVEVEADSESDAETDAVEAALSDTVLSQWDVQDEEYTIVGVE